MMQMGAHFAPPPKCYVSKLRPKDEIPRFARPVFARLVFARDDRSGA